MLEKLGLDEPFDKQVLTIDDIVADGFARADVESVVSLIRINEYKRRQATVGIRVTHRSFGKDWRYPITSKFTA